MQHALLIALVCGALGLAFGKLGPTIRDMIQRTAELTGDRGAVVAETRGARKLERPAETTQATGRAQGFGGNSAPASSADD